MKSYYFIIGEVSSFDANSLNIGPKSIEKFGAEAKLLGLNITEIINIGHFLQRIAPGVKLIGTEIIPSKENDHYFDASFKLVSFVLPQKEMPQDDPENKRGSKRDRKRRSK